MLCNMWDRSSPKRIKPLYPALQGRFLTTGPPGKSPIPVHILILFFRWVYFDEGVYFMLSHWKDLHIFIIFASFCHGLTTKWLLVIFFIFIYFFKFYFIFKLYIIVLVLPNIKSNLFYMSSIFNWYYVFTFLQI